MKFGDKYELLESLTTGGVETFVANDKVRGERVLVHILEGEGQKPNQPTVQWVLEAFRRLAPEPAGLVLEAGRYSGTLYAYLVTRMPDEAALNRWLQTYKAHSRETQAGSAAPAKSSVHGAPPQTPAKEVPQAAPAPTQEFQSPVVPVMPGIPAKPEPKSFPTSPNLNPVAARPAAPIAPDWSAIPAAPPTKPEASVARTPSPFSAMFAAPKLPPESSTPSKEKGQPGEFTSFFQGPFRGEKSSDTPAVSLEHIEPPKKAVGEFTAMFGSPLRKQEAQPDPGIAGNEPAGTGFTNWFKAPNLGAQPSVTNGLPSSPALPVSAPPPQAKIESPTFPSPSQEPVIAAAPVPYNIPTPVLTPLQPAIVPVPPAIPTPVPLKEIPIVTPAASVPAPTAKAFEPPGMELSAPTAPSAEPGAYTRIISVKTPPAAEKASSAGSASAPSLPSVPAMAPPPMPPAPPMPKIAAPAAPKMPKVAVPEPPPVSYWPLILTLTVLFFLALLLVLYFALKH